MFLAPLSISYKQLLSDTFSILLLIFLIGSGVSYIACLLIFYLVLYCQKTKMSLVLDMGRLSDRKLHPHIRKTLASPSKLQ